MVAGREVTDHVTDARAVAVVAAINSYLNEFCVGKDVDNIEDMWQSFYVSSYWRNGPVLNNCISGLDQALWDIKGKFHDTPVHQLLGGKARDSIKVYTWIGGDRPAEVGDAAWLDILEREWRRVRAVAARGCDRGGE